MIFIILLNILIVLNPFAICQVCVRKCFQVMFMHTKTTISYKCEIHTFFSVSLLSGNFKEFFDSLRYNVALFLCNSAIFQTLFHTIWNCFAQTRSRCTGTVFTSLYDRCVAERCNVRFQVLTALSVKITAFCYISPCSLVEVDRRFRRSSPWWWGQYVPLKCRSNSRRLYGHTRMSQKLSPSKVLMSLSDFHQWKTYGFPRNCIRFTSMWLR
jgi:hypothetical protein